MYDVEYMLSEDLVPTFDRMRYIREDIRKVQLNTSSLNPRIEARVRLCGHVVQKSTLHIVYSSMILNAELSTTPTYVSQPGHLD